MITPGEIRNKADKKYRAFLSSLVSGESFFPLEIPFGKVKSSETLSNFASLRKELEVLADSSYPLKKGGYYVEYRERRDRQIGTQLFPVRIYFPDARQYTTYLGRENEIEAFLTDSGEIIGQFPILRNWIIKQPHLVVQNHQQWRYLLKVCTYFDNNPHPDLYIRELPIEVDTKFIEIHKSILQKLLDIILLGKISMDVNHFESRYGLKFNDPLIRMRILDVDLAAESFSGINDLSLPVSQFQNISPQCQTVFILENINNFLTLPAMNNCIALFGSGFRVGLLKNTDWLKNKQIFYWGDIDTHGFQILSQIRGYFPQVDSFLMDKDTFETYHLYHVDGAETNLENPENLTEEERSLYNNLFLLNKKNRLEQEKIPQVYVVEQLKNALVKD